MSHNLLREGDEEDDRERAYDDAPPRRFRFMLHHFRRRRIFIIIAVVLIIAIVIVAAVPKGSDKGGGKPPPSNGDPNRANYTDVRLPSWVIPKRYSLHVNTNFKDSLFSGAVNISLQITRSPNNATNNLIVLHAVGLTLNRSSIRLWNGSDASAVGMLVNHMEPAINGTGLDYHLLYFDELPSFLAKTNTFVLSMNFQGNLTSETMSGYYLSSYQSNNQSQLLGTTQFEPVYARRAFPCFDEPELKAVFDIKLTAEAGYDAISNMPVASYNNNTDGSRDFIFQSTKNMSTYLVCYIVHKFEYKETILTQADGNSTTIRIYTSPDTLSQADYALNSTKMALQQLNSYFGIPYPLPKLDVVAIPNFEAGAMENWGIVTFRLTALLFDPVTGSAAEKQRVADVIVHELAHQWFGNLVTMKWWSDLFLNEGFATFMEYQIVGLLEPTWDFAAQFQIDVHQSAFALDSLNSSHAITNDYTLPEDIKSSFDAITYDKGASVIKMLNSVVDLVYGAQTFQKTIQNYLNKFQYSNAAAGDLWACFNSTSVDVPKLMNSWVGQPGFPYITVTQDADGKKATFTQARFLQATPFATTSQKWWIFFDAIDGKKNTYSNWNTSETSITVDFDWTQNKYLLLNADGSGFYRTLYNLSKPEYMNNLYNDMSTLSATQRTIIYDDAFNFWQAGMIPSGQVLNMLKYLKNETDYSVWMTSIAGLNFARNKLRLVACSDLYQSFVSDVLISAVSVVGWTSDGTHTIDLMRSSVLLNAANYGNQDVINTAFELWANGATLDPSIRTTVLRTIVKYGNLTHFNWILDMYNKSTVAAVRVGYLQALGSAPIFRIRDVLEFALSSNVGNQDKYIVFVYAASNPTGLDVAWRFFKDNIRAFDSEDLKNFKDDIVLAFARAMSGEYLDDMRAFLESQGILDTPAGQQALESIIINQNWINNNANDVCNWLITKN